MAKRIIVTYDHPPIAVRQHDYTAVRDGYEPGDPIGTGPTADAAIDNLREEEEGRGNG